MAHFFRILLVLASLALLPSVVLAQKSLPPEQEAYFEKHIRPALVKYCYECHSIESGKTRGGLLVDTRDGLLQGGESGAAIVERDLDESMLWSAITWDDFEMPPRQPMPDSVIAHFKQWIEMGAPDPRVREKLVVESKIDLEEGRKHWAFQPPKRVSIAGIDSIVSAKLQTERMKPAPPADAATLLRRLNFDLIGLPPTPAEVRSFAAAWKADSDKAIAAKVDELLARPQYGERWGRHWLDVARYAESSGKEVNFTFPNAWRYRDYVYDSFNEDKPYDRFVQEQIAGDLLPARSDEQWQENLIATGFLAMGTKGLNERNPRVFRADLIDEQIDTMSQAILGLTVSCARCHDHKFDPIPTTDYYAIAGIFLSTNTFYGTSGALQNRRASDLILLPIADEHPLTREYSVEEVAQMRERITEIQTNLRQARVEAFRTGKQVEQRQLIVSRNQVGRLEGILDTLDKQGTPMTMAMGVQDADTITNARVLVRGDVESPAQEVGRGFLSVLDHIGTANIKSGTSGRRELAEWITQENNPLTARVMVNRVWMHLFGDAIVRSPNNWGTTGQQPTNPKLLDHLALRFVENDWSVKALIREIVLSDAYQRSSAYSQRNFDRDPDNKTLWRMNPRQLDAEALRDAMLLVSGELDLNRPYGSEVAKHGDKRVGREISQETLAADNNYRSAYLPVVRDMLPMSLELFDFADPAASNEKREVTNVPSQALFMMNSEFVTGQANTMAKDLMDQFDTTNQQVRWAFARVYGRAATEDEIDAAVQFFQEFMPAPANAAPVGNRQRPGQFGQFRRPGFRPFQRQAPAAVASPEQQKLAAFCQALLSSAEFRILN